MLKSIPGDFLTKQTIAVVAIFLLAFLLGGASRADVTSLLALRPLTIIALAVGLWTLDPAAIRRHKFIFAMAAAITALIVVTLVPLPYNIWSALPGRDLIAEIDSGIGFGKLWRPITLTPDATWNALYALALPLSLIAFLSQTSSTNIARLLPVVAALIGLSIAVGYLQILGLPLDFYRVSNPNAGLFANRNHQALAIAIMFPILAVLAVNGIGRRSSRSSHKATRRRMAIAAMVSALLLPLVFVTGSRAGLVHAAIALVAALCILQIGSKFAGRNGSGKTLAVGSLALISAFGVLAWLLFVSDRNTAISRLFTKDLGSDMRFSIWQTTIDAAHGFWPVGSGLGSFDIAFQIFEPHNQLTPGYINHAHNDFMELFLTGGLSALILLGIAIVAYFVCCRRLMQARSFGADIRCYRFLGLFIIALCGLASLIDYPLRTPALASLFVYAIFLARINPNTDGPGTDLAAKKLKDAH